MIFVNSRFLTQKISGVQRYAIEISKQLKKLSPESRFISPKNIIHRELADLLEAIEYGTLKGHLWEQIELPRYLKDKNSVIDNRKRYILSVSTLDPRKNLESLILAFRKLKVPDLQLIIVGSKNNVFTGNKLTNLINADKNIIFTGYVSDREL